MSHPQLILIQAHLDELYATLQTAASARWGVMNAHEMVEHLNDFFNISLEKIPVLLVSPDEHLPKLREFLYSNKQFREDTQAPESILGDKPLPVRTASLQQAKENLRQTVADFIKFYETDPGKRSLHPVFGMLNYEDWIRLHYKHVTHHMRQFNLI